MGKHTIGKKLAIIDFIRETRLANPEIGISELGRRIKAKFNVALYKITIKSYLHLAFFKENQDKLARDNEQMKKWIPEKEVVQDNYADNLFKLATGKITPEDFDREVKG